jgi:drug/metabolite transporter (DMT)-like permease
MLIAPLLEPKSKRHKMAPHAMFFSLIILSGVAIMQINQAASMTFKEVLSGTVPVIIAAFAYPLGNRMMMKITDGKLDGFQRTLGMTLASTPFWIVLAIIGFFISGTPSNQQMEQTFLVALTSGVIATSMFFKATDKAKNNQGLLAAVEATQAGEVLFAIIGEVILLNGSLPDIYSIIGIALVIIGMILHSVKSGG